jgi:hypothetical protein
MFFQVYTFECYLHQEEINTRLPPGITTQYFPKVSAFLIPLHGGGCLTPPPFAYTFEVHVPVAMKEPGIEHY